MFTHTFKKEERLSSKKLMDELFESGKSVTEYPIRIIWKECELNSSYPVQLAIAVPKKLFKRAVHRNLLKRRIREAYRKNKDGIYKTLAGKGKKIAMVILFSGKEALSYEEIEKKLMVTLQKLIVIYEKSA